MARITQEQANNFWHLAQVGERYFIAGGTAAIFFICTISAAPSIGTANDMSDFQMVPLIGAGLSILCAHTGYGIHRKAVKALKEGGYAPPANTNS